jgi:hypothetical protein
MARLYHQPLVSVFLLLLAGLAVAADLPAAKEDITMLYAAVDPPRKKIIRISVHYVERQLVQTRLDVHWIPI